MSVRDKAWPTGTPCWADLMVTDREAAWAFYRTVLGWEIADSGPDMGHYGIARVDGKAVAGVGEPPPGDAPPPAWTTYLATDDLDATLAAVQAHGGQVAVPAMEVGDTGRMAVGVDPTGAVFGMWQAKDFVGTERVNEPGAMVWNQNVTRDPDRSRDFYSAVFGRTFTAMPGDVEYWMIDGDGPGNTVGGLGHIDPSAPEGTPPAWEVYFMVADADAAAARTTAAGGSVRSAPADTAFGRMAVLADPSGAVFSIMQDTSGQMPA